MFKRFLSTTLPALSALAILSTFGASTSLPAQTGKAGSLQEKEIIKAYNIDFNWGPGGAHKFAKPGLWADANPQEHVEWYAALGCNVIQSFAVSCNGYAWYKNGIVPEQPGLKHDFLTELVKLGRKKNMKVFGYFCVGANNKWEQDHPDECYRMDNQQIPLTKKYLDYLCASIEDAIKKTDMDGFMLDWLYNPGGGKDPLPRFRWIPCEQKMYQELMNRPFPGADKITPEIELVFRRKSIERAWKQIRETAKRTKPSCLIWLSANNVLSKEYQGNSILKEVDWLLNELGNIENTEAMHQLATPDTQFLTCLAAWNKQDPRVTVPAALKHNIGLFGFTKPVSGSLMPPVAYYLSKPLGDFKGDELNIAVLARVYNNLPFEYVKIKSNNTTTSGKNFQVMMTSGERTSPGAVSSVRFDEYVDSNPAHIITLDLNAPLQEIDGFGAAMTGSSAYLLKNMDAAKRRKVLRELFDPKDGIGISALRLSIGASDFSVKKYTYCDTPPIGNFSIHPVDKRDLLPVLKEVLAINPDIKFFATTWTAPLWMRKQKVWTGGGIKAGLKDAYIDDFATYYLKYVQAMAAEGIKIYAVCPQNEPLSNNNPVSMRMPPKQQIAFIKALSAKFAKADIKTKVICFDHNWDLSSYVDEVYADSAVFKLVDGAAFHAYGGNVSVQSAIHEKYPSKNIYFTELSGGTWSPVFENNLQWLAKNVFIGGLRRWTKAVILWNLMLDANRGPALPGAAGSLYGVLDLAPDGTFVRRAEYYMLKQMRGIRPGAKIVKTSGFTPSNFIYVAALNTDGTKVFVAKTSGTAQSITISDKSNVFSYKIPPNTIISFQWK